MMWIHDDRVLVVTFGEPTQHIYSNLKLSNTVYDPSPPTPTVGLICFPHQPDYCKLGFPFTSSLRGAAGSKHPVVFASFRALHDCLCVAWGRRRQMFPLLFWSTAGCCGPADEPSVPVVVRCASPMDGLPRCLIGPVCVCWFTLINSGMDSQEVLPESYQLYKVTHKIGLYIVSLYLSWLAFVRFKICVWVPECKELQS